MTDTQTKDHPGYVLVYVDKAEYGGINRAPQNGGICGLFSTREEAEAEGRDMAEEREEYGGYPDCQIAS